MVDATTGGAFAGVVTVFVTIDGGTQAIGTVGSGLCTAEGNGYFSYAPSVAEVTGSLLAFTFIGTGAIPATIQVQTITAAQSAAVSLSSAANSTTVSALITAAFQRLDLVGAADVLSAEDLAIGFARLNDFVNAMAIERLLIYTVTRTTWTITATQDYTVGPSATINVARPALRNNLTVRYQDTSTDPDLELSLGDLLTDEAWAAIPNKGLSGVYPQVAYYNPTFTSGFGTISLWPIPSSSTLQGVLYAPTAVPEFAATADTVALPPGWRDGLGDRDDARRAGRVCDHRAAVCGIWQRPLRTGSRIGDVLRYVLGDGGGR
jgi:hypothetical protein